MTDPIIALKDLSRVYASGEATVVALLIEAVLVFLIGGTLGIGIALGISAVFNAFDRARRKDR